MITMYLSPRSLEAARAVDPYVSPAAVHAAVEVAVAAGDMILADGLTYLFGRAGCGVCGSTFDLADWFEAENSDSIGKRWTSAPRR